MEGGSRGALEAQADGFLGGFNNSRRPGLARRAFLFRSYFPVGWVRGDTAKPPHGTPADLEHYPRSMTYAPRSRLVAGYLPFCPCPNPVSSLWISLSASHYLPPSRGSTTGLRKVMAIIFDAVGHAPPPCSRPVSPPCSCIGGTCRPSAASLGRIPPTSGACGTRGGC